MFIFFNILVNEPIKLYRDIYLIKEIGVKNFEFIREMKYLFDPHIILNPHISLKKSDFIKDIRSKDKVKNYIFDKIKI